jgi:hypothetical protein
MKEAEPDERLFDISTARNISAAIDGLSAFGETENYEELSRRTFRLFYLALKHGQAKHSVVAQKLYYMAFEKIYPEDSVESKMITFSDELEDAMMGIYGNPKSIKEEIETFLAQYKC